MGVVGHLSRHGKARKQQCPYFEGLKEATKTQSPVMVNYMLHSIIVKYNKNSLGLQFNTHIIYTYLDSIIEELIL